MIGGGCRKGAVGTTGEGNGRLDKIRSSLSLIVFKETGKEERLVGKKSV